MQRSQGVALFLSLYKNEHIMDKLSNLAESLMGSEIVRLSNEINQKIAEGKKIYNYTIGDFSSKEFPIPQALSNEIGNALREGHTNYPDGKGILALRESVAHFINRKEGINYSPSEIQIASGGRPLIYTMFQTIVNPRDKVIYATPSWNNNHYTNLNLGEHLVITTTPENHFMPTAEQIEPLLHDAVLLCLCTPQNPTGTTIAHEEMNKICELIVKENEQRKALGKRLLYVLFDQMYFTLTFGAVEHYNPISINEKMKEYTVLIDGISKAFAATGIRVGWACGPENIIKKMSAFLSHIGAWAPTPAQFATAKFLKMDTEVDQFLVDFKSKIEERLHYIAERMNKLKQLGYNVDCIDPQAAIYLTIKIDLKGKKFEDQLLSNQAEVTSFLLEKIGLAIVPFYCFGDDEASPWYRISIGTSNVSDLKEVFDKMETVFAQLQ